MEQIPKEVMEKIEKEFPILESASNADKDYMAVMSPNDTNWNRREGAIFGYRLASPCALCEGKEKEIAELRQEFKANYFLTESLYKENASLEAEKKDLIAYTEYVKRRVLKSEFPMTYESYK